MTGDENMISAFDALSNTEHYVTFSGTTGLQFSWDIAESRGQALASTHSGGWKDAIGGSFGFGFDIGRRRLEGCLAKGLLCVAFVLPCGVR